MTVQPIDNTSAQSTQKIDFQAFRKAKEALAQAEKTGNEDQIAISKEALQQAENALKNDMKNVAKSPHTHHHRHGYSNAESAQNQQAGVEVQNATPKNLSVWQDNGEFSN